MNSLEKKDGSLRRIKTSILRWIDSEADIDAIPTTDIKKVDWLRILPLLFLHVMCLGVLWVGWSWTAVCVAALLYFVRMFAITGFYHRYFSHKAFKTSRLWQFIFAVMGNASVQRGPIWWAAHHRHHHRYTDQEQDVHSPSRHGFWWSHIGWLTSKANFPTNYKYVAEWAKYPELRWLNRFDTVIPILLALLLFIFGVLLEQFAPNLGTNGLQMVVWGFFISTTVLLHATLTINSLDHMFGSRRYETPWANGRFFNPKRALFAVALDDRTRLMSVLQFQTETRPRIITPILFSAGLLD